MSEATNYVRVLHTCGKGGGYQQDGECMACRSEVKPLVAYTTASSEIIRLQAAVELQMERCAALKGYAGKLRAAIYCAHDILHRQSLRPDGFLSQNEQDVDAILAQALDVKAP
jgi:hypothetical protein